MDKFNNSAKNWDTKMKVERRNAIAKSIKNIVKEQVQMIQYCNLILFSECN